MNDLSVAQKQLPETLPELSKFVLASYMKSHLISLITSRGDYMPKVKSTFKDQQNGIRKWIAMGKIDKDLKHDQLAKRLAMSPSTLSYRITHPETIRLDEFWLMEKVLGKYQEF